MRRLFVDTSAYFALTDKRDENHEAAAHFIHQFIRERTELLTTNYIIAETHTLLLNRIGYTTALQVGELQYDLFSLDAPFYASDQRFDVSSVHPFSQIFSRNTRKASSASNSHAHSVYCCIRRS